MGDKGTVRRGTFSLAARAVVDGVWLPARQTKNK